MGILNPAALPLFALLGILILVYLRERWRKRIEVSSLMFWNEIREDAVRVRRFFPSLLFLIQALLLILLLSGLLHPYRPHTVTEVRGNRHILVFDVSASMQVREGNTQRFSLARNQATQVVRSLGPLDEVMLISVAARPRVVSGFTTDHRVFLHLLESLRPADSMTNLDLGIELALAQRDRAGQRASVYVFTDVPQTQLSLSQDQLTNLVYHQVGRNDDNIALAALNLHQNPFQHYSQARAYILVRNYASRTKRGTLTVDLNERQIFRRAFSLPSRETMSFSVGNFTEAGQLVARISPDDGLSVDNQALAWVAQGRERRLVLVSATTSLHRELQRVSRSIPNLSLTAVTPDEFSTLSLDAQDIVLFHQFVPSAAIAANSLYVFPPLDNPLFPVVAEAKDLSILDWRESHEILHNLQYVDALPLKKARVLALPSWAQVLISSRTASGEVPLALTGEKDGHRVVCLAFDLGRGNLTDSDNLSLLLLFLNAVRWLLPPDPSVPALTTPGETFFVPASIALETLELTLPSGETRAVEAAAVEIPHVGAYRLQNGDYQAMWYANLFDEIESDIGRRAQADQSSEAVSVILETSQAAQEVSRTVPIEFGQLLYYGAAALLFLEWLYALWRYTRARAQ